MCVQPAKRCCAARVGLRPFDLQNHPAGFHITPFLSTPAISQTRSRRCWSHYCRTTRPVDNRVRWISASSQWFRLSRAQRLRGESHTQPRELACRRAGRAPTPSPSVLEPPIGEVAPRRAAWLRQRQQAERVQSAPAGEYARVAAQGRRSSRQPS